MARVSAIVGQLQTTLDGLDVSSYNGAFPVATMKRAPTGDVLDPGLMHSHLAYVIEPGDTTPIERTRAGATCNTPITVLVRFDLAAGLGDGGVVTDIDLARDLAEDVGLACQLTDTATPGDWHTALDGVRLDGPDEDRESILIDVSLTATHHLGA